MNLEIKKHIGYSAYRLKYPRNNFNIVIYALHRSQIKIFI